RVGHAVGRDLRHVLGERSDQVTVLPLVQQAVEHEAEDLVGRGVTAEHRVEGADVGEVPFDDMAALLRREAVGGSAPTTGLEKLERTGREGDVCRRAARTLQEVSAGPVLQELLETFKTRIVGTLVFAHLTTSPWRRLVSPSIERSREKPKPMI